MKRVTLSLLFAAWVIGGVPSTGAGRIPGHRIQRVIVFGDSMTERRNVFARFGPLINSDVVIAVRVSVSPSGHVFNILSVARALKTELIVPKAGA